MSANVATILNQYGALGVEVLKQSISSIQASGKTAQSIRFEVESSDNKDRLMLIGRKFFELIEKGIRPSGKNPPPEMIQMLTEYAKARGMDKPESAAWGIAKTILKEGDKTYRSGGRLVYSPELVKFVQELQEVLTKQFKKDVITSIRGAFKGGGSN